MKLLGRDFETIEAIEGRHLTEEDLCGLFDASYSAALQHMGTVQQQLEFGNLPKGMHFRDLESLSHLVEILPAHVTLLTGRCEDEHTGMLLYVQLNAAIHALADAAKAINEIVDARDKWLDRHHEPEQNDEGGVTLACLVEEQRCNTQ